MTKHRLTPLLISAALGASLTPAAWAQHAAIMVGTGGVGADWSLPLTDSVQTRIHVSFLRYNHEETLDDIDYKLEFDNVQFGTLFDWYPFEHGMRLTAGLLTGDYGVAIKAKAQATYEIGGRLYTGDIDVFGDVDFNRAAPFIGLGWGAGPEANGISLAVDIGVLYIGKPVLSIDATGTARTPDFNNGEVFEVTDFAPFQEDLERERAQAQDDVDDFRFYPIVNIGLSYTF